MLKTKMNWIFFPRCNHDIWFWLPRYMTDFFPSQRFHFKYVPYGKLALWKLNRCYMYEKTYIFDANWLRFFRETVAKMYTVGTYFSFCFQFFKSLSPRIISGTRESIVTLYSYPLKIMFSSNFNCTLIIITQNDKEK